MTRTALTHHPLRMKKPDSRKANAIFTFTPMPTYNSVLMTAVR